MAMNEQYRRQVALLVRTLPIVAQEKCFALKGGTAINLFIRDMPRLSVDIDLTYLPLSTWAESTADINRAMAKMAAGVSRVIPGAVCTLPTDKDGLLTKILVRADGVQIMVEVTPVLRGCVYEPELRSTSSKVQRGHDLAGVEVGP